MVTPEELEALDLLCWLRNGDDAARLAYCNQSTISRRSQQALQVFNPLASHGPGPHPLAGPSTLLQMEREVHQLYRLSGRSRLRLHAPYWASRVLGNQLDAGWMVNPARQKESVGAALSLLEGRVIDAIIAEASQRPADDNPKFFSFDLYEVPLVLCVDALAEKQVSKSLYCEKSLSSDDVRSLSRVRPLGFLSPESKECVVQLFNHLYGDAVGAEGGFDQPLQDSSQVTFLMAHHPSAFEDFRHFRRIDCECGFRARESLVVLRGLEENPSILGLLETLSSSYLEPLRQHSEVVIDKAMAWNWPSCLHRKRLDFMSKMYLAWIIPASFWRHLLMCHFRYLMVPKSIASFPCLKSESPVNLLALARIFVRVTCLQALVLL